jgi:hypothetical protein
MSLPLIQKVGLAMVYFAPKFMVNVCEFCTEVSAYFTIIFYWVAVLYIIIGQHTLDAVTNQYDKH